MEKKSNKSEWIAIVISIAVALFIVIFTILKSPEFITPNNPKPIVNSENNKNEAIDELDFSQLIDINSNSNMKTEFKIEDVKVGNGAEATSGKTVVAHYEGFLANGDKFDSSKDAGRPFEFVLGQGRVILGWDKGILGMKVGGLRKLEIPPEMAYGERGVGTIPPNSTLYFIVELLDVKDI